MFTSVRQDISGELDEIRSAGLFKAERVIVSPQGPNIRVGDGAEVLNLCANNYLGLADDPRIVAAAKEALDRWGYGLASVRFICGTQDVHKQLEQRISGFLGTEDTILYSSCFDANGGLFETLLGEQDAVISDELNHASIIDGIRLCKARRLRYRNRDMADLEAQLKASADARRRLIATDGVFSMDGYVTPLGEICDLADRYDAMVMVDDSHAVGFVGAARPRHARTARRQRPRRHRDRAPSARRSAGPAAATPAGAARSSTCFASVPGRTCSPIRWRRRWSGASLKVLDLLESGDDLRARLRENTAWFRERMTGLGFDILPGDHPIVPVMIGDAARATRMADLLLEKGVYVIGFSYPVVPVGKARIRTQVSAAHSREDLQTAATAFAAVRAEMS